MKKTCFLLAFSLVFFASAFAQKPEEADKLVDEGIAYNDKGDFTGAIKKFEKALDVDKDNIRAYTEKAYTLLAMEKYKDCIAICKKAIKIYPEDKANPELYINYGTALDDMKKTDESIDVYEEGIKYFPTSQMLYFNKGITLFSVKKYDDALLDLQKSISLNPRHPGSHNAIARILYLQNRKVPSFLAFCRFLVLEQNSDRAKENYELTQKLMGASVKKKGERTVITMDVNMFNDSDATTGKRLPNKFKSTEMILSTMSIMDNDILTQGKSEAEILSGKIDMICRSLKESKKDNYGFYWDYYVPYFLEMNEKGLTGTFANIALMASPDKSSKKWIKEHGDEIDKFYEWSKAFEWKGN